MILESFLASAAVALSSLIGVFFFGNRGRLVGMQKFIIPVAVGVFLSLIFYELVPETLASSPNYGGLLIALGFLMFYVLSSVLHKHYHHLEADDCDRKGAAMLLLIGDSVHGVSDGVILGSAFLIDPTFGVAITIALILHELPQEIVEFGVLIRAGYSRTKAALLNLFSASSIFIGVLLISLLSGYAADYIWVVTGLAAGNLLYLSASDLLPRIHGNLKNYGSVWHSAAAISAGFLLMTSVLYWTHQKFESTRSEFQDVGLLR